MIFDVVFLFIIPSASFDCQSNQGATHGRNDCDHRGIMTAGFTRPSSSAYLNANDRTGRGARR